MNIYVANLSWGTQEDSLQNLFAQYGEVTSVKSSPTVKQDVHVALALLKCQTLRKDKKQSML